MEHRHYVRTRPAFVALFDCHDTVALFTFNTFAIKDSEVIKTIRVRIDIIIAGRGGAVCLSEQ